MDNLMVVYYAFVNCNCVTISNGVWSCPNDMSSTRGERDIQVRTSVFARLDYPYLTRSFTKSADEDRDGN